MDRAPEQVSPKELRDGFMNRKIFWSSVVAGLVAFFIMFCFLAHKSADVQLAFLGMAIVLVLSAAAIFYGLIMIYSWNKGTGVIGYRYGAKSFSRDTDPFNYWLSMLFNGCLCSVFSVLSFLMFVKVLHALLKIIHH